jgi:hypothetical protein
MRASRHACPRPLAIAAAADGTGGAFIAGYTPASLGGPNAGAHDVWLAAYDGLGNQLWIRQLGTGDADFAFASASDGSGGVCICGYTRGSLGAPNAGFEDTWLAHYSTFPVNNSQGRLCLGGAIGRYVGAALRISRMPSV